MSSYVKKERQYINKLLQITHICELLYVFCRLVEYLLDQYTEKSLYDKQDTEKSLYDNQYTEKSLYDNQFTEKSLYDNQFTEKSLYDNLKESFFYKFVKRL